MLEAFALVPLLFGVYLLVEVLLVEDFFLFFVVLDWIFFEMNFILSDLVMPLSFFSSLLGFLDLK